MALATVSDENDIARLACDLLGQSTPDDYDIVTPGDLEDEKLFNRLYPQERDALQREHPWNFAIAQAVLVEDGTPPSFGYAYRFALPADQLRILTINGRHADMAPTAWRVVGDYLWSNQNTAKCQYIKSVTDEADFDAQFTRFLAYRLAIAACMQIRQDPQLKVQLEQEAERLWGPIAKTTDAREDRPKRRLPHYDSRTLSSRFYGVFSEVEQVTVSDQWLELTATIADGTTSIVVPYVDSGGNAVTMPVAPTLDEIILTPQFADGGTVTSVYWQTGDPTTSQITIRSGASNHGGISIGLRIKVNT